MNPPLFRHEFLEKVVPVTIANGDFVRADGDVVVIEGGDVSGVDDIGFVNAEKQAGGKLFLHGLESHFGNDPLIFQLENHVIFQSLR